MEPIPSGLSSMTVNHRRIATNRLSLDRKGIPVGPCVKAVHSAGGGLDTRAAGSFSLLTRGMLDGVDNVRTPQGRHPCGRARLFIPCLGARFVTCPVVACRAWRGLSAVGSVSVFPLGVSSFFGMTAIKQQGHTSLWACMLPAVPSSPYRHTLTPKRGRYMDFSWLSKGFL